MSYEEDLEKVGDYLEAYDYPTILQSMLDRVPNTIDKREGAIIYDALAPAAYQLAEMYLQLRYVLYDVFAHTAVGDYLDKRAEEFGITRIPATFATKYGYFTNPSGQAINVAIGTVFSTVQESEQLYYTVTASTSTRGTMILTCQTAGTVGNQYSGTIIPVTNIRNLGSASMGTSLNPARDTETDEELRARFFIFVNEKPFGGNFIDYYNVTSEIDGIGGVQVYPVWNGGGTVKIVIIDAEYNINNGLVNLVKNTIDPEPHTGEGQGIAPIGHKVTVVSPTRLTINVSVDVEITGYTLEQLRESIIESIDGYIYELRTEWDNFSTNHTYNNRVFRAEIITRLINNVTGISNVKSVLFNGVDDDLSLRAGNTSSDLPFLGEVTINAVFS